MTTITLASPVEHAGKTYTSLTFREAETGDLMAADKFEGQTSKIAAILASMCDVPLPAFRKIKAREFARIMKEVEHLMGEKESGPEGMTGD